MAILPMICTSMGPSSVWVVDLGPKNWRTLRVTVNRANSLRGTVEAKTVALGKYMDSNSPEDLRFRELQNLCTSTRTWSAEIGGILIGRIPHREGVQGKRDVDSEGTKKHRSCAKSFCAVQPSASQRGSPTANGCVYAVPGTQRHGRKSLHWRIRQNLQMIALVDRSQKQGCLHHGECRAHADPGTAAEGKIGIARNEARANRVFTPAFGIEAFRIREEARIPLGKPLQDKNISPGLYAVAANLALGDGSAAHAPYRRVEAHNLLDHHLGITQSREIFQGRSATTKDGPQFFHQHGLNMRIHAQQETSPG